MFISWTYIPCLQDLPLSPDSGVCLVSRNTSPNKASWIEHVSGRASIPIGTWDPVEGLKRVLSTLRHYAVKKKRKRKEKKRKEKRSIMDWHQHGGFFKVPPTSHSRCEDCEMLASFWMYLVVQFPHDFFKNQSLPFLRIPRYKSSSLLVSYYPWLVNGLWSASRLYLRFFLIKDVLKRCRFEAVKKLAKRWLLCSQLRKISGELKESTLQIWYIWYYKFWCYTLPITWSLCAVLEF